MNPTPTGNMKLMTTSPLIGQNQIFLNLICLGMAFFSILLGNESRLFAQAKTTQSQVKHNKSNSQQKAIFKFNGKDLKGIEVLKKNYFEDNGEVLIKDNQIVLNAGKPGTGIRLNPKTVKGLPQINYEVLITAKRIKGGDFFCGLTFPVRKSYCSFILGGWGGGAIGLSNVDSLSAIENETSGFHEFKDGVWYDIHLIVSEKTIKATLKEAKAIKPKQLFELETTKHKFDIWWEQEPVRPFGISTWSTTAAIKRFEIRKLEK